jgi:hypothetical protein
VARRAWTARTVRHGGVEGHKRGDKSADSGGKSADGGGKSADGEPRTCA